jgi:hypothetical protein
VLRLSQFQVLEEAYQREYFVGRLHRLHLAPGDTTALEALLPDRWLAAHPEQRLEQREEELHEAQPRRRRTRAARRIAAAVAGHGFAGAGAATDSVS